MVTQPRKSAVKPRRPTGEKGRRARIGVDFVGDVSSPKNHATVQISNLSLAGCRLVSPCAFPKGEAVQMRLPAAEHEPEFLIRAEIRWLALNPEDGPFVLGCRFLHTEETTDRLERLIRSVIQKKPQSSVGKRAGKEEVRDAESFNFVFATDGLDRLLRPGLSSLLRELSGAPRGGSGRS